MIRNWILKTADGILGPPVCGLLAALTALRGKAKAPQGWNPNNPKRILLIRPGGIGDMIVLLPAVKAIMQSFPSAEIDIVCEQRNLPVIDLADINVTCMPYDKQPLQLLLRLMRTNYDIAIDSEQFHHSSAVFAALSGAAVRVGFNINPRRNGLYTHLIPYAPDGFEGDQFLRLLHPLDITDTSFHPAMLKPALPERELPEFLTDRLQKLRKGGRRLIIVHSGGSIDRKRWDEDKLAALVARLADQPESSVIVLGSKSDQQRTARIKAKAYNRDKVESIAGSLTLKQCAALISISSIFVGPDSGLMHLATACGVPTVAIFGPSDQRKWGYGGRGRNVVVRHDVPCSPCFIFGYSKPCSKYECIEGITVDDVARACNSVAAL